MVKVLRQTNSVTIEANLIMGFLVVDTDAAVRKLVNCYDNNHLQMSRRPITQAELDVWLNHVKDVIPLKCNKLPCVTLQHAGSVAPPKSPLPVLDLHGMTVQQAHEAAVAHVASHMGTFKWVTIITGKSGVIKSEAETWLASLPGVSSVSTARGDGALVVKFKKRNRN